MASNAERASTRRSWPATLTTLPPAETNKEVPLMVQTATDVAASVAEMRRLVADLDYWQRREADAYREGYYAGHRSGWDVGYAHANHEINEAWHRVAEHVRSLARVPTIEEQRQRQYPGHTADELRKLRGRDKYPLTDRECPYCYGRGIYPGGAA